MSVDASLAQLDRVTGYEPVGQGFESLTTRQQKSQQLSLLAFLFVYLKDSEPINFRFAKIVSVCAKQNFKLLITIAQTAVLSPVLKSQQLKLLAFYLYTVTLTISHGASPTGAREDISDTLPPPRWVCTATC